MRRVQIRLPMHTKDPRSGEVKQIYANYQGFEQVVDEGERKRYRTARLFNCKNAKGEDLQFRIRGNGQYEMTKLALGNRPIATGTMMDAVAPEIIPLAE